MLAVTVLLEIVPGQMSAFLPRMVENARASLNDEVGCVQFDVCQNADTVFLYELYADRAAFEQHLTTPHYLAFDRVTAKMIARKTVHTYARLTP